MYNVRVRTGTCTELNICTHAFVSSVGIGTLMLKKVRAEKLVIPVLANLAFSNIHTWLQSKQSQH